MSLRSRNLASIRRCLEREIHYERQAAQTLREYATRHLTQACRHDEEAARLKAQLQALGPVEAELLPEVAA